MIFNYIKPMKIFTASLNKFGSGTGTELHFILKVYTPLLKLQSLLCGEKNKEKP